ncbi:hypothetical protein MSP8887_01934 [Marinomonas spartinae]|uniref:Type VI secretion-associated protein, VC_A0118 family n=1 Tax=Marinomonas spartinae TaxID=1792290 RepID=A0A1A8TEI4_9GAMM|nr:hypothetical protein [Marinomonas spartinae]SBS30831.1 hypothetical protein MSP8886_01942 [Marinomonas spartinae]SBS33378.1 hypothetical protein MSP8887_01934 [Marinomonas spartinae]
MFRFILMGLLFVSSAAFASLSSCDIHDMNSLIACLSHSERLKIVPKTINNGHWVYTIQATKDSDTPNVFIATLLSSSSVHYIDRPVEMTIRCKDKKANFQIHWKGVKLKEGSPSVIYHFDNGPNQSAEWDTALGRQSLEVSKPMDFIRELAKSKQFMVQATTAHSPSVNAVFNTSGLANLMPVMKGLCY